MKQASDVAEELSPATTMALAEEEEFVLELTALDEQRVEGFVHHLKSGYREEVRDWNDVTEIISRFLESEAAAPRHDST